MKRVLLVDDEPEILETVGEFLTQSGIEVKTAQNGRDALHLVFDRENVFSVIVSDFMMPIMDGATLYQKTRFKKIPFIMMTSYIDDLKSREPFNNPDLIIVDKPLILKDLLTSIENTASEPSS